MKNVLQHPNAAAPRVENPRSPGRRPANVTSLTRERASRSTRADVKTVRTVKPPKAIAGTFNYPKSLLRQAYFCLGGDGTWHAPRMDLRMLVSDKFVSPIGALLDQLEQEGHDVGGARGEWMAFRELAKALESQAWALERFADEMRCGSPTLAIAFIQSGERS